MNVFDLRNRLIGDYAEYVRSFINIRDDKIRECVDRDLNGGLLWPEPRIGLNPSFEPGGWIDELVDAGLLHNECRRIFRARKTRDGSEGEGMRLHRHQADAINAAKTGNNYVLTTGTGSGKSLAYIVPIVDHVLRSGSGRGIKAIVVYPMNALANSQAGELEKFLSFGYPDGKGPVSFRRYTGQEKPEERDEILASPPDILLTNYVMLELLLTRVKEKSLVRSARGLRFLVMDELHTYRGRQGADVAMLIRRTREACEAHELQCVGTSATLATQGSFAEQRAEIARVASLLFGSEVPADNVIGETLKRETVGIPTADELKRRLDAGGDPSADYEGFVADPLSAWIETTFGIEEREGRLVRTPPRPIAGTNGAAEHLSTATGVDLATCQDAIERQLLAGYGAENPDTRFPVFAFRLHQFISRGDTAYATIEPEDVRYITTQPQQFVPNDDRTRRLFPLVFCRECGQEYYSGQLVHRDGVNALEQRDPEERIATDDEIPGYLYVNTESPWSENDESRVPEDWIEERPDGRRVRLDRRKWLPKPLDVDALGNIDKGGVQAHFIEAPFRFCLTCGVTYGGRLRQDFTKVGMLGSEGRSTATTILSQSVVRTLRQMLENAPEDERRNVTPKLLSFTDNRQDAALQAGHFNDFVDVGLLRSALYRAAASAGPSGLTHEVLTQRVFDELALPFEDYAANPAAEFKARTDTERALRDVLGYRLYLDLRRGWRITSPNLEQCGLLDVAYESLDEVCKAEHVWTDCHEGLAGASPAKREKVAKTLLDHMRRELAIKVDYLDADFQERLRQMSSQRLIQPWALDDQEEPEHAAVMLPRGRQPDDYRGWSYLSPRSGFGIYLRRELGVRGLADTEVVIKQLLAALERGGLVEKVSTTKQDETACYQVPASAFIWRAGDGTRAFHDPIRVPNPSKEGGRANPFFVAFYKTIASQGTSLRAGEHTAAVPYDKRMEREEAFREARLPVLFCSPTMELGVDIADLNIVNMRNVPPTPANYAQRSGRAGRSGQPALVFTYCSAGSPHDQYFFRHQQEMVSGQVAPPRIDVTNEDLLRSHVQAIWLTASGMSLERSLKEILDLSGDPPSLRLLDHVESDLSEPKHRAQANDRARRVLADIEGILAQSDWWTPEWLDDVLNAIPQAFESACDRWRSLYSAARAQAESQHRIIIDHSRTPADKRQAERQRREAVAQMDLLTADTGDALFQSDFYSYRYFASEGFLPGYSFPRLPLSAFVPGRRGARGSDEFLNRPRFLAIREFGPRNIIYYEGSRYVINKVILPVGTVVEGSEEPVLTRSVKQCDSCGYLHPLEGDAGPDLCEGCGEPLDATMNHLFRLQNVATKRRDRINSDEEERTRHGYDLRTGLRFGTKDGKTLKRTASIQTGETEIGRLEYGHTATVWLINLGWRRRANKNDYGFVLDVQNGFWARRQDDPVNDDPGDPMSARTMRVIPYVEDRKNCLVFEPVGRSSVEILASLQAALKNAITVVFQLEDHELAAEPLPSPQDRRRLLIYEGAEGGAGVLRRLVEDPDALGVVAKKALELCHYDPDTFEDQGRAPGSTEDCEAACYDCLMSYTNQPEHRLLDRKVVKDLLVSLASARVIASPAPVGRGEHLGRLKRVAASDLERRWLDFIDAAGHTLPDRAGTLIESAGTRPDFLYDGDFAAVYIDGPPHDFPDRQVRDREKHSRLEDLGYTVIRFPAESDWAEIVGRYPWVFGKRNG